MVLGFLSKAILEVICTMGCQMKGKGPGTFNVLDCTESQFSFLRKWALFQYLVTSFPIF